jgi:coenzyme PQQ synthesis protein D (PqqD)
MMTSSQREIEPHAIDESFVAERDAAVHAVEVDGEAVLLNEGRLHLLNATGALVWACFDGTGTIAEIAADISEGLGVPYETVLEDTLAVARHLGEEGLLASVTPAAAEKSPEAAGEELAANEAVSKWASDPRFVDEPPNP